MRACVTGCEGCFGMFIAGRHTQTSHMQLHTAQHSAATQHSTAQHTPHPPTHTRLLKGSYTRYVVSSIHLQEGMAGEGRARRRQGGE